MTLNVIFYSDICDVNLSFGDWLDGLQKTVENATKQESSSASKGLETIISWLMATIYYIFHSTMPFQKTSSLI